MNKLVKDEKGIAYGIVMIALGLILSAILYSAFSMVIDPLINDYLNHEITAGHVSIDTTDNMALLLKLFTVGIPLFTLIVLAEYGIVRAIESKYEQR